MNIIRVGENYDFSTINSAISAASHGDLILIEPGDYRSEGTITITKAVHLVGNTTNLDIDPITIKILHFSLGTSAYSPIDTLVVESITINSYDPGMLYYPLRLLPNCPLNIKYVFNKCKIAGNASFTSVFFYDNYHATFINTEELNRYHYGGTSINKVAIRTFIAARSNQDITYVYDDHVREPTTGYGYLYGHSYFKLPSKYIFSGKVTISGSIPVERTIKAYRRDTDTLLAYTSSDATTGDYKLITEYPGEHYLVCKDSSNIDYYNDLIRARVYPSLLNDPEDYWQNSSRFVLTISGSLLNSDLFDTTIPVFLSSSSGRNNFDASIIFDELIDPKHSTRIYIQDENNLSLFAEIVKWDTSVREVLIWVRFPFLDASKDTKVTLYYDREKPDNLYNVGYANNITISHTWGPYYNNVWHFNDHVRINAGLISSTFIKSRAIVHNLTSDDSYDAFLDKAIDFSAGYLSVENSITALYDKTITINALVKFNNINERGTIICIGDNTSGLEVGVENGNLFSCLSAKNYFNNSISTTLSGLDLSSWHLVTTVLDEETSRMSLYIDDVEKAYYDFIETSLEYYAHTPLTTIGSYGVSSPHEIYKPLEGVYKYTKRDITTISGTVVSGTVFSLQVTSTSYSDITGRHNFIPKHPADISINTENKRFGQGSLRSLYGVKDSNSTNAYNFIQVTDNLEDFGFEADQDFCISFWFRMPVIKYNAGKWYYTIILGGTNPLANNCLTIYHRYKYYSANDIYWYITIPNDSGGFVVKQQRVYYHQISATAYNWTHIVLSRKSGYMRFYFNGSETYSVQYSGKIPSAQELGLDTVLLSFNAEVTIPYNDDFYGSLGVVDIVKGYHRWDGNFDTSYLTKGDVDTFFSGQIDDIMIYRKAMYLKDVKTFRQALDDNLITFS
jgi:hypothetical protein